MQEIKSFTDLEQSKKLAEILPLESADMVIWGRDLDAIVATDAQKLMSSLKDRKMNYLPCWSLAALLNILPEINGIPLTFEKVKAKDGYEGYYYHIEYKDIVLIPYSKNPVDACYEIILALHELKML